jgi:hypothetical protein
MLHWPILTERPGACPGLFMHAEGVPDALRTLRRRIGQALKLDYRPGDVAGYAEAFVPRQIPGGL